MAIPSLGRGNANTLVFGIGSHLKFGEQPNLSTSALRKRDDADEFSKYNIAVNSMTVTPTSTLLTPGVIPITVEQPPGVPGPVSIAGNFTIDALPARMELFWRQLLNAPHDGTGDLDLTTTPTPSLNTITDIDRTGGTPDPNPLIGSGSAQTYN